MQPKVIVCLMRAGIWQTSHFLNLLGGDLAVTMVKCHALPQYILLSNIKLQQQKQQEDTQREKKICLQTEPKSVKHRAAQEGCSSPCM